MKKNEMNMQLKSLIVFLLLGLNEIGLENKEKKKETWCTRTLLIGRLFIDLWVDPTGKKNISLDETDAKNVGKKHKQCNSGNAFTEFYLIFELYL